MTPETETKPAVPFYINQPCGTCSARVGPDGVWISDCQQWCRECARGLVSLLVLLWGGDFFYPMVCYTHAIFTDSPVTLSRGPL